MRHPYAVRIEWNDEDEAYVATSPEFPGLVGADEEKALAEAELHEAIEMVLEYRAAAIEGLQ